MLKIAEKRIERDRVYFSADASKEFQEGVNIQDLILKVIDAQKRVGFDPYHFYGPLLLRIEGTFLHWECFSEPKNQSQVSRFFN